MNREQQTMAALTAARPAAFEPSDHPDPELRARDLRRILARPPSSRRAAPTRPPAAPRRRFAAAVAGAVLAAVAAAALLVPGAPQPTKDRAPVATGTRHATASARQFLLVAAERVVREPASTGAVWFHEQRYNQIHTFGTGGITGAGPPYTVEVSYKVTSWAGRSRSRAVTTRLRPRFLTDRDRAAWRAGGSPYISPFGPPGGRPEPSRSVNEDDVAPDFIVGGEGFTIAQLQRLPADSGRLAPRLRVAVQELLDNWPTDRGSGPPNVRRLVFHAAADLLNLPVTPAVRAAALEVMAGSDGARLLGRMEDPAGRQGTGITFPDASEADLVLIVDEATATLLASQLVVKDPAYFQVRVPVGTVIFSTTWLQTGWTDRFGRRP